MSWTLFPSSDLPLSPINAGRLIYAVRHNLMCGGEANWLCFILGIGSSDRLSSIDACLLPAQCQCICVSSIRQLAA